MFKIQENLTNEKKKWFARARVRALPLLNLKKKRYCSQSIYEENTTFSVHQHGVSCFGHMGEFFRCSEE